MCETAGYNRTTFYKYYCSIYDLLECAVEDLIAPAKDKLRELDDIKKWLEDDGIQQFFLFILKMNNRYIELLMKQQHHNILEEKIKALVIPVINQQIKEESPGKKYMNYFITYQIAAAFGLLKHWFESGKDIKERELVELVYNISSRGVLTMIRDEL